MYILNKYINLLCFEPKNCCDNSFVCVDQFSCQSNFHGVTTPVTISGWLSIALMTYNILSIIIIFLAYQWS